MDTGVIVESRTVGEFQLYSSHEMIFVIGEL